MSTTTDVARCDREIAAIEAEIRAGNPDLQGLCLGLADWSEARRYYLAEMARAEAGKPTSESEGLQAPQTTFRVPSGLGIAVLSRKVVECRYKAPDCRGPQPSTAHNRECCGAPGCVQMRRDKMNAKRRARGTKT